MLVFITGAGYRLPFETFAIERFRVNHKHRDRTGFSWAEPMDRRVCALSLSAIRPANNDNEVRRHG
jgi:hypothetical protein